MPRRICINYERMVNDTTQTHETTCTVHAKQNIYPLVKSLVATHDMDASQVTENQST